MRWPAFLTRKHRLSPREAALRTLDAQITARLASRKADRAARQERARRGARTKTRQAFVRDRLRNEQVTF